MALEPESIESVARATPIDTTLEASGGENEDAEIARSTDNEATVNSAKIAKMGECSDRIGDLLTGDDEPVPDPAGGVCCSAPSPATDQAPITKKMDTGSASFSGTDKHPEVHAPLLAAGSSGHSSSMTSTTAAKTATAAAPSSSNFPASPSLKHILVPLANGTDAAQLSIITSTLCKFGDQAAHVVVASIDGDDNRMCTTGGNLRIQAEHTFDSIKDQYDWDVIVFAGGMGGAKAFAGCQPLMDTFRNHVEAGKMYAATGESPAFVLTQVPGALPTDDLTCTPNNECYDLLGEAWVDFDVTVSPDNRVVTSQGTGPAFLFAIQVGELLFGRTAAKKVANTLLVDRTLSRGARYLPRRHDLERFAVKVKEAEAKADEAKRAEEANQEAERQAQQKQEQRRRNRAIAEKNRAYCESQLSGPAKEELDRLAAWSTPAAREARDRAYAARLGRPGTSNVVSVPRGSIEPTRERASRPTKKRKASTGRDSE